MSYSLLEIEIETEQDEYEIWTDGHCLNNPGPGGYAAIIKNPDNSLVAVYDGSSGEKTTNNRMEILAVILGLSHLPEGCQVKVFSDSQYVVRTINGEYRKKSNVDLWQKLDAEIRKRSISAQWVKAHAGIHLNELADQYALKGANGPGKEFV